MSKFKIHIIAFFLIISIIGMLISLVMIYLGMQPYKGDSGIFIVLCSIYGKIILVCSIVVFVFSLIEYLKCIK